MKEIIHKFKFRDAGIVINAPADIEKEFVEMGFKNTFSKNELNQNTVAFINNNKELLAFLQNDIKKIKPDSVLWLAYPKGSSKVKTDINRDIIRETAENFGMATVTAISIDDTWSGLRFRPIHKGTAG
jgi:hypothetical protein